MYARRDSGHEHRNVISKVSDLWSFIYFFCVFKGVLRKPYWTLRYKLILLHNKSEAYIKLMYFNYYRDYSIYIDL